MPDDLLKRVRTRRFLVPAWYEVRKHGLASPSSNTRQAIRDFAEFEHRRLERIQERLRENRYQFSPAMGVTIDRPGKEPRPIVVQDVADRIVQRSILDVVMDVQSVENAVRNGTSFGGVPELGVPDAVRRACSVIRDGAAYYLCSDIKSFFPSIPRADAVSALEALLPEDDLLKFIDEASEVELVNGPALGDLIGMFPDETTGVPQGHCLSALFGNLLLRGFDALMNSGRCVCLRYLDDFMILGPDRETVWRTFRDGKEWLRLHGFEVYDPHADTEKASEGSARSKITYLGCEISPGFVLPSRANRNRLLEKVTAKLEASKRAMFGGGFTSELGYRLSVTETLGDVSEMARAWAAQFKFCNADQVMDSLDERIDGLIADYLGAYQGRRDRCDRAVKRRMLGVWRLSDVESTPLLPLD